MKASEEFLQVVIHGHIVAASETLCVASGGSKLSLSDYLKLLLKNYMFVAITTQSG